MKEQFLFLLYFPLFLLLSFKFSSSNTAFSCTRQQHFFIFLFLRQSILSYRQIIPKTNDKYLKKRRRKKKLKGFPECSAGNESTCNAGDPSSIPGSERSPGKGRGYPLQYSGLENSMDCIVMVMKILLVMISLFKKHLG